MLPERLLFAADMGLEHRMHAGDLPVARVRAGPRRTGRDLVGVIADPVVE